MGLNRKQQVFVDEFVRDLNPQRAYQVAYGKTGRVAESAGRRLATKNAAVATEISKRRTSQVEKADVDVAQVLRHAWLIGTTDAREIIQFKVGCCRHCYGEGFRRQRTVAEHNGDFDKHVQAGNDPGNFDHQGGIGYDARRPPKDDCPECMGEGVGRPVIRDTRYFTPGAAALYAGVKQTKDGLQVLMHDKLTALEKLFRHAGLYEKDNSQRTPLADALRTFVDQLHADEAGKIKHAGPRLATADGKKTA